MKIEFEPCYPVSITGVHGAGKKTLRDGIAAAGEPFAAVSFDLVKLGRIVDAEGLETFRDRYLQLDARIREHCRMGRWPVTSRFGILDIAIVASFMARVGRIETGVVESYLARLRQDAQSVCYPRALIAMVCRPEALAERLRKRDLENGLNAPRGAKALAGLVAFLEGIYVRADYPHPAIAEIVSPYKQEGRFLSLDTSESTPAGSLEEAKAFLGRAGIFAPAAPRTVK